MFELRFKTKGAVQGRSRGGGTPGRRVKGRNALDLFEGQSEGPCAWRDRNIRAGSQRVRVCWAALEMEGLGVCLLGPGTVNAFLS